jgi:N-methylhydantoinase A
MGHYRIAVDTGGTFTDVIMLDSDTGNISTVKVPSTPANPDEAVVQGVLAMGVPLGSLAFLGHGTTVAINTLVQRKGATVGLLTTKGFRDVLEIQRTNRPDMYNLFFRKPPPPRTPQFARGDQRARGGRWHSPGVARL